MLWLDGLLAHPTIGIKVIPSFKEIDVFRTGINSFIDYLIQQYSDLDIEITNIFGYTLRAKKVGHFFSLTHENIVAGVGYYFKKKPQPGKLPKFEMPEVQSYTEDFALLQQHLDKLLTCLTELKSFKFNRIGIVAETNIDKDSLPPGVQKWIKNLEKSLGNTLIHSRTSLLSRILENDKIKDQCHHIIDFDDYKPELGVHVKLDWQRLFNTHQSLSHNNTLEHITACKEDAFDYFEKFAEGNLENG